MEPGDRGSAGRVAAARRGRRGRAVREIAGAIGRHLGVPAVSIPAEEAKGYFGFLAMFVSLDNPASSALTRKLVGWRPEHPGLLDDLGQGHYFQKKS